MNPIGVSSEPAIALMGIDGSAIERLDLPYKLLTADDAARLQVIVPPRFGANRRDSDAAERFMKLFPPRPRANEGTGEGHH